MNESQSGPSYQTFLDEGSGCKIIYPEFGTPTVEDISPSEPNDKPTSEPFPLFKLMGIPADGFAEHDDTNSPTESLIDCLPQPSNSPVQAALEARYGDVIRTVLITAQKHVNNGGDLAADTRNILTEASGLLVGMVDAMVEYSPKNQPTIVTKPHDLDYFCQRRRVFQKASDLLAQHGHGDVCNNLWTLLLRLSRYTTLNATSSPFMDASGSSSDAAPHRLRVVPEIVDDVDPND